MSNTDFDPTQAWASYDPSQGYGAPGSALQPGQAYGYDTDFFKQRGMPNANLQGPFGDRLQRAVTDAEAATGAQGRFSSGYRDQAEQARLYANYQNGTGGLAAAPGMSRHQYGAAADLNAGPVRDWVRQNAGNYGLETIRGDTPHIQIASADYNRTQPNGAPMADPASSPGGGSPDYSAMMQAMAANPQDDFSNRLQRAAIFLQGISNPSALSALGAANKDAEQRNQMMMHLMGMKQSSDQHAAQMAQQQQFHADTLAHQDRSDDRADQRLQQQFQQQGFKDYLQTAPKDAITGKPQMPGQGAGAGGIYGMADPSDLASAQAAVGMNAPNASLPAPATPPAYGQAGDNASGGPALQAVQAAQAGVPAAQAVGPQGVMGGLGGAGGWGPAQGGPSGPQTGASAPQPPTAPVPPQPQQAPQGPTGAPQGGGQPPQSFSEGDYHQAASNIRRNIANGMTPEEAVNRIHDPGTQQLVQSFGNGSLNPDQTSRQYDPQTKMAHILAQAIYGDDAIQNAYKMKQANFSEYQKVLDPNNTQSPLSRTGSLETITNNLFGPNGIVDTYDKLGNRQTGNSLLAGSTSLQLPWHGGSISLPGVNSHFGATSDDAKAFDRLNANYGKEVNKFQTGTGGAEAERTGPFSSSLQPNEMIKMMNSEVQDHIRNQQTQIDKAVMAVGGADTTMGRDIIAKAQPTLQKLQAGLDQFNQTHKLQTNDLDQGQTPVLSTLFPTGNKPAETATAQRGSGLPPTPTQSLLRLANPGGR